MYKYLVLQASRKLFVTRRTKFPANLMFFAGHFTLSPDIFVPHPSLREEGGLLNLPSSSYAHSCPCLLHEKHYYIIKAGDSRATRTLVKFRITDEQRFIFFFAGHVRRISGSLILNLAFLFTSKGFYRG